MERALQPELGPGNGNFRMSEGRETHLEQGVLKKRARWKPILGKSRVGQRGWKK